MEEMIEAVRDFYQVDRMTVTVILLFCGMAGYFVRQYLTNPASVWLLAPVFVVIALTTYVVARNMQMFSPSRTIEWITYSTFSAAIGAMLGILLVALLRIVQDRFITAAHIRQTLKRDAEQAERGYPQVDA